VDGGRARRVQERRPEPAVLLDLHLVPAGVVQTLLRPGSRLLLASAARCTAIPSWRHSTSSLLEVSRCLL